MSKKIKVLKIGKISLLILVLIITTYFYHTYQSNSLEEFNKVDNNVDDKNSILNDNNNDIVIDENTNYHINDEIEKEQTKENTKNEENKIISKNEEKKENNTENNNVVKESKNETTEKTNAEEQIAEEKENTEETPQLDDTIKNEENNTSSEDNNLDNQNTFNQEEYEKLKKDTYPTYEDCANKGIQLSIADETNSIVGSYCETLAYQGKLVGYKLYLRYESGELIRYIEQS